MKNNIIIKKLAIAVTFFYAENHIPYLKTIYSNFSSLAKNVQVHIFTNIKPEEAEEKLNLEKQSNMEVFFHSPTLIGHPFLLTWAHFSIFRNLLENDKDITHFLYLEDDLEIKENNIKYWLKGRELLRKFNMIPSFLRFEYKDGSDIKLSTDNIERQSFKSQPQIVVAPDYCYINLKYPYQGMYLFDQELLAQHLNSYSSNPDFGPWGIREKAAQGITFANVPQGFLSRNLVGFDLQTNKIDPDALVHHLPNNYANNPNTPFGKIPCHQLIIV